jgi:GlcNAc-P-P-Und epimerase
MRIAVTGSSGFIGAPLVRELLHRGHEVLGIDRRGPTVTADGFSPVTCDILERAAVVDAFVAFGPEAVIHLAARTDLDETSDLRGYATNIEGVEHVIDAIEATRGVSRAVFTSTQLVCRVGYVPRHDQDYQPNTLYGESKVQTERIVRARAGGGLSWCLVRPTTVWGPGMSAHYQRFFRMVARGRYFHVGARPLYKTYGYLGNVIHQYIRLLAVPSEAMHEKTLYVADYQPISLRSWTDAFARELGSRRLVTCPEPLARAMARAGDVVNAAGLKSFPFNSFRLGNVLTEYRLDMQETERVCGALPFTMHQGVVETASWLKSIGIGAAGR